MALETATYIDGLVATNPAASDAISSADDHLRLIKSTLKNTFPNVTGAVTKTHTEINGLAPMASPIFTGTPAAPTASPGTNTTQVATTAFVTAADVAERTASATLTNKTISADNNTLSGLAASSFVLSNSSGNIDGSAEQKAIPSGVVVGTTDSQTLTNKSIALGSNTVTGTKTQFNTAVTDTDFAFLNDFTGSNQSLTTNGYQKLPGGFTILWGSFTSSTDGNQRVEFHTAFPTTCVFADVYPRNDTATLDLDRFGFTVNRNDSISSTPALKYFAIGW